MDPNKRLRLAKAITKASVDFDHAVEPIVGRCPCGGLFSLEAPIRCPECQSTNVALGNAFMDYI